MIGLALLLVLVAPASDQDLERARELRAAGRLGEAWEALARVDDTVAAERERVELYYAAGDFGAALAHAEAGLALAPADLGLLHRALSLTGWVGDPERMDTYLERLGRALPGADLAADERATWDGELARFRERRRELGQRIERREAAVARARGGSLTVLVGVLAALGLLARGGRETTPRAED